MNVNVGENGALELREVYNPVTLRVDHPDPNIQDEKFDISMRDGGFEFRYSNKNYIAQGGVISAYLGGEIQNFDAEPKPVSKGAATGVTVSMLGAVNQDLVATKYNVEAANNFSGLNSGRFYSALNNLLTHRQEVAQRLLKTVRSKNPQQVEELHNLFEYDQTQLRRLLGMTLPGD